LDARVHNPAEASIGDLFKQVVADGRTLVGAEVNLYKQIAKYRAGKAKSGLVALVAGGLLAFAALIAFMVGLMLEIAHLLDSSALAGLALLAVTGLIAFSCSASERARWRLCRVIRTKRLRFEPGRAGHEQHSPSRSRAGTGAVPGGRGQEAPGGHQRRPAISPEARQSAPQCGLRRA
jgi:hypothetical protein